jgi:hypothetical protein
MNWLKSVNLYYQAGRRIASVRGTEMGFAQWNPDRRVFYGRLLALVGHCFRLRPRGQREQVLGCLNATPTEIAAKPGRASHLGANPQVSQHPGQRDRHRMGACPTLGSKHVGPMLHHTRCKPGRPQTCRYRQSSWALAMPSFITASKAVCFLMKMSLKALSWRSRMACSRTSSSNARNVAISARVE